MFSVHRTRWLQLDSTLFNYRQFWQFRPFDYLDLPWRDSHPNLCSWLDSLEFDEIIAIDLDHDLHYATFSSCFNDMQEITELIGFDVIPRSDTQVPARLKFEIPGRKLAQIVAFSTSLPRLEGNVLEWCAGKGHLGRLLSLQKGCHVQCLEIQPSLCQQGRRLAKRAGIELTFNMVDVMKPEVAVYLKDANTVVALHACGDLHRQLLNQATEFKVPSIYLAPCCYHAMEGEIYQTYSIHASQSRLSLSRFDIKLALQETVTAEGRIRKLRDLEVNFRLGFDLLCRDITGKNRYQTVPPVKDAVLRGGFRAFCEWAADVRNIDVPNHVNYSLYEQAGRDRRPLNARMELVRHVFRRPLEAWLMCDRAIFMEEQGYTVTTGQFCERNLTPRNILISAHLNCI